MDLHDPDSMNEVLGNVLRYGVILSAAVILVGTVALAASSGGADISGALFYEPATVPHGNYSISLSGLVAGLLALEPYAVIELGVLMLLATPVSRVLISVLLFAAEKDRQYVYITLGVLSLLLFSMLVTPFIPGFNA